MVAAARVFAISELLENILIFVDDPLSLLRCESVNRLFHATMQHCKQYSKSLRRALFLEPDIDFTSIGTRTAHVVINPLLDRFRSLTVSTRKFEPVSSHDDDWYGCYVVIEADITSAHLLAMLNGSWKSMLVSQPPCPVELIAGHSRRYFPPGQDLPDCVTSIRSGFIVGWPTIHDVVEQFGTQSIRLLRDW